MRLIDADALQEHFEKVKKESARLVDVAQIIGVQAVIDSQPTVYDVDKVVGQLEEMKNNTLYNILLNSQSDDLKSEIESEKKHYNNIIECVKGGGVNE